MNSNLRWFAAGLLVVLLIFAAPTQSRAAVSTAVSSQEHSVATVPSGHSILAVPGLHRNLEFPKPTIPASAVEQMSNPCAFWLFVYYTTSDPTMSAVAQAELRANNCPGWGPFGGGGGGGF